MTEQKSFLDWEPLLTPEQVFANTIGISYLSLSPDHNTVYWLESRASEKGRITLVKKENSQIMELTPKEYNLRSRVHEYGGRPYVVGKNYIYFVNFMDQRIYKQDIKQLENIEPLTPEKNADGSFGKYVELIISQDESRLYFIYEQEFSDHSMPKNSIACLDLTNTSIQEPKILIEGNDFYIHLTLSNDGSKCCWLTWNLPYMPWDSTELWLGKITSNGIIDHKLLAGGNGESITSPIFGSDNEIYFIMDFPNKNENEPENYWNIYRYKQSIDKYYAITKEFVEFGQPLWNSGNKTIVFLTSDRIFAQYRKNGQSRFVILDLTTLKLTKLKAAYTIPSLGSYVIQGNKVIFTGASGTVPIRLSSFELDQDKLVNEEILKKTVADEYILEEKNISIGKLISFPTKDNEKAYCYLYLPKNQNYSSMGKPPLLILVHGGPTANSDSNYANYIQYWTSSGFAVIDIEHRGSTGFGRKYRDKLLGNWGLIEISDIEDAIKYLVQKNVIMNKVAITGGSAGGYTVQRALTSIPDLFQVGGSHFGIGNLLTLKKLTHKFESKYLDLLIGEEEQRFIDRSPVNHLDKLKAPMIIFQGLDDKVVPPELSREIAEILKQKGIKSEYIEYPGEGHGFRQLDNKVDSLKKESIFFKEVLKEK
jgi:dipeptidyl aminopeptidase/acylaminoacyl peptidase